MESGYNKLISEATSTRTLKENKWRPHERAHPLEWPLPMMSLIIGSGVEGGDSR